MSGERMRPESVRRRRKQLSLFAGAHGFRATVTARKLLHAARRIDELLLAGEKRMTSSANADLNITTRRAGVIDSAAGADDIGLVIFWMNARFHIQNECKIYAR
jgi:hypothetical protein